MIKTLQAATKTWYSQFLKKHNFNLFKKNSKLRNIFQLCLSIMIISIIYSVTNKINLLCEVLSFTPHNKLSPLHTWGDQGCWSVKEPLQSENRKGTETEPYLN